MIYAVLNKSTLVSDADAAAMAAAVDQQMKLHIAPAWGRVPATVMFVAKGSAVPAGAQQMVILDHADQAGALGYHDETPDGQPYSRIFAQPVLSNGGVALAGHDPSVVSVASVLSHEAAEQFVDPTCNMWVDGSITAHGKHYAAVAMESADPVEDTGYFITLPNGTKVTVSNFVCPAWFDGKAPVGSTFDFLKLLHTPFSMTAGGYLIVRTKVLVEKQVFAEHMVMGEARPEWRTATKKHSAARSSKRTGGNIVGA